MPNFIGCAHFGSLGVQERKNCTVVVVRDEFRGADKSIVDQLVSAARNGMFVCQPETTRDKCPVLPTSYKGSYCRNGAVNAYETVPVSGIPCSARYQYLIHEVEDVIQWEIVVGVGFHDHVLPFPHPSAAQVQRTVHSTLTRNPRNQCRHLMAALVEEHGCRPSIATVQRRKYDFHVARNPFGRHLNGLIRLQHYLSMLGGPIYVWSIDDQRLQDETRVTSEQFEIVICMGNMDLLKRSVAAPHYSCDGTFNMVSQSDDLLSYKLIYIICKDPLTGRMYSPFRAIASRKTTAARRMMLKAFLVALHNTGLHDPLSAAAPHRLTMSTYFEKTFSLCIGELLAELFRPQSDMTEMGHIYVQKVCFGCGVHAKRMIIETINIQREVHVYHWLVGTRNLETEKEVNAALTNMATINVKLGHFARWIRQNRVAKVLWFWRRHKTTTADVYRRILWSTKIKEVEHSVLKGSSDYLLTRCKGLDLVSLIKFLEEHDRAEFRNLTGELGLPHVSIPLLNRAPRKRKRDDNDGFVVIDCETVHASQPKKAKRT